MKWYRTALACAAILTTLALTSVTTMPAKAAATFKGSFSNTNTGKCLGIVAANMNNGTPAVQWSCDLTPNQSWIIQTPNGFPGNNIITELRNSQDTGKCLGVAGAATDNGSNLVIWDCNGSSDQLWDLQQVVAPSRGLPWGCYNIANVNAFPRVAGVLAANTADGAQAVIWDNLGHPDQVWCPTQRA